MRRAVSIGVSLVLVCLIVLPLLKPMLVPSEEKRAERTIEVHFVDPPAALDDEVLVISEPAAGD